MKTMQRFGQAIVILLTVLGSCSVVAEYRRLPEKEVLPEGFGETYISGFGFYNEKVVYKKVDGLAIFEGDIILGSIEEVEEWRALHSNAGGEVGPQSIIITGERFRWPNNLVAYQFDRDVEDVVRNRVEDAIAHWEANTPIRFVERNNGNAGQFPDFVEILQPDDRVCNSFVGRRGGEQTMNLHEDCIFGSVVHEFGHALGLWHEHSREDRDRFVTIIWDNIRPDAVRNFNQRINNGDDIGEYDYGSIMHYGPWAFSVSDARNDATRTIVPLREGAEIGQRDGLSTGDIDSIVQHYPEFLPVARLTKTHYSVFLGNDVFLDGRPSFSPSGSSLTYSWRLDDGTTVDNRSRLNHIYQARGSYQPTLTVIDDEGNRDSAGAKVTVYGSEILIPIIANML